MQQGVRDPVDHALADGLRRDVDRIPDHPLPGASVRDDHGPLDAQERRSADDLVVEAALDPGDRRAHQQAGDLAPQRAVELGPQHVEDVAREALEELDHHVADDRVAHDDVGHEPRQVLALDVADEVEVRLVEQLRRARDAGVALALLLADREQGHPRPHHAQHVLAEDGAHPRVLRQVLRGGVGVRADVQEHERHRTREHHGEAGPVDAGERAEDQLGRRHPRACVTRGHDGVGVARLDELGGDPDGAVGLADQGPRRVLVHPHDLGGVHEADVAGNLPRDAPHHGLVAHQNDGGGLRACLEPRRRFRRRGASGR